VDARFPDGEGFVSGEDDDETRSGDEDDDGWAFAKDGEDTGRCESRVDCGTP